MHSNRAENSLLLQASPNVGLTGPKAPNRYMLDMLE
jgi:hypothetical protein